METSTAKAQVVIFPVSLAPPGKRVPSYREGDPGVGSNIIGHGTRGADEAVGEGFKGAPKKLGASVKSWFGGRGGGRP